MEGSSEKKFPVNAKDYELYEEVGEGVSAIVYRALCIPLNEIVAIKVLDLERCNNDLDGIRREVQTMILINHPNLLRAHCSFTTGHNLWVVMPYMAGGSCLHIMKSAFPEGFEEPVIATLLREVLKALVYLHSHGHIHRDVKAGNILVDTNGAVKLADFGVSACMFDTGDRQRSRNTFVGTPCWMAPEVMQQLHGYDFKADIWSFGITALELAHGHAPFSKYPPMKVLLMTLQNAPPGLDYERDRRFSKSFKEMVAACLVKDPKKRPSSEKLLKHPFFNRGRSSEYLARNILNGLPPLGDRFRVLKTRESEVLVQNKALYEDKEHLSQQEYIRGISAWNFNLEDLKNQAALIPDDEISSNEGSTGSRTRKDRHNDVGSPTERLSSKMANHSNNMSPEDGLSNINDLENSLAGFPIKPLQALKGCFDVCKDEMDAGSPNWKDVIPSNSEQQNALQPLTNARDHESGGKDNENLGQNSSLACSISPGCKKFLSGSLSPKKGTIDGERESLQPRYQSERNYSGPLQYHHKKEIGEDPSEGAVIQRRGRFKVTSADLSPKGPTNCFFNPASGPMAAAVLPSLQYMLQQNMLQRDEIIKLIKYVEQTSVNSIDTGEPGSNGLSQALPTSAREKDLLSLVIQLQQSIGSLAEELQLLKMKNAQMEKKLNAILGKEDKE
ncbi:serine/threonine-protein kinase BLUS1-like isoform X1 [Ipomoea triloba]|uniref:serine/threonine-protein kinase BLUS1-like isoform X1 n=1 Tax=Ipomoea triloba TaxID=35885 RepID=UPI00125DC2DF|nr:serine/threonine-protein kinase BLUS1-like isoform X1 [Ipomoea triloba]